MMQDQSAGGDDFRLVLRSAIQNGLLPWGKAYKVHIAFEILCPESRKEEAWNIIQDEFSEAPCSG